ARSIPATSAPSPRQRRSSSRASAGRTLWAAATAPTPSQAAWRAPGRSSRHAGTTASSRTSLSTTGADQAPGRGTAVDPQDPRGAGPRPGRPRPVQAPRPDDADDRSGLEARPGLRTDREALLREPRPARGGVRQGLVQAASPGHGTDLALPRPVDPGGAAVAGPGPRHRPRAHRRGRDRIAEGEDPRLGALHLAARLHRLVRRGLLPRHRQARWSERGAYPPRAPKGLGGQRTGRARDRACDTRADPAGL